MRYVNRSAGLVIDLELFACSTPIAKWTLVSFLFHHSTWVVVCSSRRYLSHTHTFFVFSFMAPRLKLLQRIAYSFLSLPTTEPFGRRVCPVVGGYPAHRGRRRATHDIWRALRRRRRFELLRGIGRDAQGSQETQNDHLSGATFAQGR